MAALALPVLEAIVLRVLAAIGVGVAGGVAVEEAQKRRKETDKAGDVPIARSDTKTGEKCKECPPDNGQTIIRKQKWAPEVVAYQVRICGLPFGDGWITEWHFSGVDFDGFDSSECLLKEAKSTYDQFFDEFGYLKPYWQGEESLLKQASAQSGAAVPQPPVRLRWYFMEPKSYRYFSKIFSAAKFPIETVYQP